MKITEAETEIRKIVEWYRNLPNDFLGLNDLLHQRQKLVGYNVTLGSELGYQRKLYSLSKAVYEKKRYQLQVKFKSEGVGNSETISRANSSKEYTNQQESEGEYYRLLYFSKSIEQTLSSMSQQIAVLREELNSIKYRGG